MLMDEWDLIDPDLGADSRGAERRAVLWQTLENDRVVPDRELVALLSNLLDDDLLRMRMLWPKLALTVRRELLTLLEEISKADFAMDFTAIFRLALADGDADVRAEALRGLDEDEDVRLVPELVRILRHDPSAAARQAAAEGLGRFVLLGELEKIRPDPFRKAVQALQACYTDSAEEMRVRQRSIEAMAYTGDYGVPAMIKSAYTDGDATMRRSAVVAMGRSADDTWGVLVQRELVSPDPRMRLAAVRACGELQLRAAAQDIVGLTDDVSVEVQATALWALGQIGGTLALRTLQRFARGDDEDLAAAAEEAVQELEFLYGDASSFFGAPETFIGETDGAWRFPGLGDIVDPDADEATDDADATVDEVDGDTVVDSGDADYLVGYLSAADDDIDLEVSEGDRWDDDDTPYDDGSSDED